MTNTKAPEMVERGGFWQSFRRRRIARGIRNSLRNRTAMRAAAAASKKALREGADFYGAYTAAKHAARKALSQTD